MKIHPTAVIGKHAELGEDVTVGPMAYIEDGARIGAHSVIGPHAAVLCHTTLGVGCKVHAHAVLGDLPQDMAFTDAPTYARIGDRCVIREGVTVHRGTKPETATEIGDDCFFMVNSHVGHNCRLADHVIMANGALLGGYVDVGARVFISGNCLLHQFIRIGRVAMLAGGCALNKDVPPFCTTHGVAGNRVAGLNIIGMRRAGMAPPERLAVKRAFRMLYRSGINFTAAARAILKEFPAGPACEMAEFVAASKRGICPCRPDGDGGDDDHAG